MAGKKVTHSEDWWAKKPPHAIRCNGSYKTSGKQCRREGLPGSSLCREHGGLAPAVHNAAAVRLSMASDELVEKLLAWADDPKVEMREKVKIAQDLLDRTGLSGALTVKLTTAQDDPIDRLFSSLLNRPDGLLGEAESRYESGAAELGRSTQLPVLDGDLVEAELVEDERPPVAPPPVSETKKGRVNPSRQVLEALDLY